MMKQFPFHNIEVAMAFRDVRLREMRNRLVFRFDPEQDLIAIVVRGELVEIDLNVYRLPNEGCRDTIGVDFQHVDGEEQRS
jgi:hypothetical protein